MHTLHDVLRALVRGDIPRDPAGIAAAVKVIDDHEAAAAPPASPSPAPEPADSQQLMPEVNQ